MKVEIIEEQKFGHIWPWYILSVDGEDISGSWNKSLIENMFSKIIAEGKFEKYTRTILKSQEINVSLNDETLNTNI